MKAAVVSRFDRPPRFADVATPTPSSEHEVVVEVLAAGLHPRVRSQANGSHYTSTDELPLVPGVDGVGRGPVPGLGATDTVLLGSDRIGRAAEDVDVVIDYVWGAASAEAMIAVVTDRADRSRPLTWIEIGSVAGPTADIPSAALRAARLQIIGNGQGSVSTAEILAELPGLAAEIGKGTFRVDVRPVPLAAVEQAWAESVDSQRRIVLTPRIDRAGR
jgi:NADPH:quinone reductase-like Zn-dependent oxidoreductase